MYYASDGFFLNLTFGGQQILQFDCQSITGLPYRDKQPFALIFTLTVQAISCQLHVYGLWEKSGHRQRHTGMG